MARVVAARLIQRGARDEGGNLMEGVEAVVPPHLSAATIKTQRARSVFVVTTCSGKLLPLPSTVCSSSSNANARSAAPLQSAAAECSCDVC
eukprot:6213898-Pleurochrysis_carterae.AAC.1